MATDDRDKFEMMVIYPEIVTNTNVSKIIIYLCLSHRRSRQEQCRKTRIASCRKPFPIRLKRIGLTSGLFVV